MNQAAIERACSKLSLQYARLVDQGDFESFSLLFTPDGVLDLPGRYMAGRKAIVDILSQRPRSVRIMHVFSNIMIENIQANRCSGTAYITAYRQDAAGIAPQEPVQTNGPSAVGYYEDEFELNEGMWRFRSRKLNALFCG